MGKGLIKILAIFKVDHKERIIQKSGQKTFKKIYKEIRRKDNCSPFEVKII